MNKTYRIIDCKEKLLPCPFCGSKEISMWDNPGSYSAQCNYCGAGFLGDTLDRAIKKWNRRVEEIKE